VFDPMWQRGNMNRNGAYKWLTARLGVKGFHWGTCSDPALLIKAVALCLVHGHPLAGLTKRPGLRAPLEPCQCGCWKEEAKQEQPA